MAKRCRVCNGAAQIKRPKTGDIMCKECFYYAFEEEIHHTVLAGKLFTAGETVAIGASGGKDSTVLAHVMTVLNERHNYGLNLILLSVDEGITGYRDDSLETVKINQQEYGLPLKIVSYQELYGWTMDSIVQQIGLKNNCTYCGVFRRQALDRGAMLLKVDKIVTGHNADDIAETVIMNVLRGDIARLRRCTAVTTGTDGALPRCKPFKYTYEKDIVMYAFHKNLTYFSTECIYSPNAYRGFARAYIKDLERIQPSAIIDIIHSGESLCVKKDVRMPVQTTCSRCGYISSNELCKACVMLEGLNKGRPRLGIGKTHKERRLFNEELARQAAEAAATNCNETTTTTTTTTTFTNSKVCCGGKGACGSMGGSGQAPEMCGSNLQSKSESDCVGSVSPSGGGGVAECANSLKKVRIGVPTAKPNLLEF
ncbi:cytoplasmic tRNA 2-thiolation protein 1-like isoform X2 [Littorina saxatilis]|uniref:Cytoplasmic tRNA 2-thiolation protein 1 n=1 Tax=Littorina saxatilis TaxID=31220 RepID=A0AAN9BK34_9CAEN